MAPSDEVTEFPPTPIKLDHTGERKTTIGQAAKSSRTGGVSGRDVVDRTAANANDVDNHREEEEEEEPHIDEETFRAWQQSQAEAESSAMERQAKAQSTCCFASFQLIIVCVIVGKLEHSYDNTTPGDTGYSAFWALFPIFLVTGLVLCCCSCLIYGAGGSSSLDSLVERAKHHGEDDAQPTHEGAGDVSAMTNDAAEHVGVVNVSSPTVASSTNAEPPTYEEGDGDEQKKGSGNKPVEVRPTVSDMQDLD
jgi:hypothetical protein